ncbi:MAG TPA: RNA polymerase sigma factor [Ilumatobacteraceae bacterium]|nr:RNA polymerase sigma factor [Ilumatobacteraceae bacterium]
MTSDRETAATGLLHLYDRAMPQVYGYLVRRCGVTTVAEDLTADVFMAAVAAIRNEVVTDITVPWLIGTARHKLIDHWRRSERQQRAFRLLGEDEAILDSHDEPISAVRAHDVLEQLSTDHRAALTLRYIDDLPVADVARALDRSEHATESLLQRAKAAFRHVAAMHDASQHDTSQHDTSQHGEEQ